MTPIKISRTSISIRLNITPRDIEVYFRIVTKIIIYNFAVMRRYDNRLVAILITVIIHLTAGIIFMIVRMGNLHMSEIRREYEMTLQEPPRQDINQKPDQNKILSVEQVIKGDQELQNIARNLALKPDVKINREDYIDKVKEELIESGKLGKDNYIDEQKKEKEKGSETVAAPPDPVQKNDKNSQDANEAAARFSGPTRIYYYLQGRTHTYLPLPIYKCEGAGKVVVAIEVTPRGDVISTTLVDSESSITDPCLSEAALSAARQSKFSPDSGTLKNQSGTITYVFVAQ